MNEDLVLPNNADPTGANGRDPVSPISAEAEQTEALEACSADDALCAEEAVELSAPACENPDLDLTPPLEEAAKDGLEQLRNELNALRKSLTERDAFFSRLGAECEEFSSLFPKTALSEIPDSVWEDVRRGLPLAAAYALAERRHARTEEIAAMSNLENKLRSAGAVSGTGEEYFSPAEVRMMSRDEVRTNYSKIMNSMRKWR